MYDCERGLKCSKEEKALPWPELSVGTCLSCMASLHTEASMNVAD